MVDAVGLAKALDLMKWDFVRKDGALIFDVTEEQAIVYDAALAYLILTNPSLAVESGIDIDKSKFQGVG